MAMCLEWMIWTTPRVREADPMTEEGGESACWLARVCEDCGRLADEDPPTTCPGCGAELTPPD